MTTDEFDADENARRFTEACDGAEAAAREILRLNNQRPSDMEVIGYLAVIACGSAAVGAIVALALAGVAR
jgi:hypothetical protein